MDTSLFLFPTIQEAEEKAVDIYEGKENGYEEMALALFGLTKEEALEWTVGVECVHALLGAAYLADQYADD